MNTPETQLPPTATETPEPVQGSDLSAPICSAPWRFLKVGERVRDGDQYLGGSPRRWHKCRHDLGHRVSRHGQDTVPVRRALPNSISARLK